MPASVGGSAKMSQPPPPSTCGNSRTSRRKARSASAFLLKNMTCVPVIMGASLSNKARARARFNAPGECNKRREDCQRHQKNSQDQRHDDKSPRDLVVAHSSFRDDLIDAAEDGVAFGVEHLDFD